MNLKTTSAATLSLVAFFSLGSCSTESETGNPVPDEGVSSSAGQNVASKPEVAKPKVADAAGAKESAGIYNMQLESLAGEAVDTSSYAGKVSLVVNVASECGYTRQYAGLQKLHDEFAAKGFQVLGFPCNDFGGQEPGTAEQIGAFCRDKFGVTFPMFAKVRVKGDEPSPVYEKLIAATGKTPGWNFCKYLVSKDGEVLHYWNSSAAPSSAELRAAIAKAL